MIVKYFSFFLILISILGFLLFAKFNFLIFFPFSFPYFDALCLLDWFSLIFISILVLISGRVLLFSKIYMEHDIFSKRFTSILVLFILRMLLLIIFPFSIMFFLGWDGLGILRFLLVNYYKAWTRWSASLKTYLIKRLGDGFFILLFAKLLLLKNLWLTDFFFIKISLIFILGCFTKSAQIPFRTWLPAAMAAPTPVSSLVHSSTLVTAGVYLLFRFWNIYKCFFKQVLLYLSLLTAFIASLAAAFEWDSKKIIAFSTLSNLGIMIFSLGLGLFVQGFFHLLTHAIAKAKLFVNVGYMIKKTNHHQDSRILSKKAVSKLVCRIFSTYSVFRLSGIVFFSGFFSKEKILEKNFMLINLFVVGTFYLIIFFRLFYGFRLIYLLNFKKNQTKTIKSTLKARILRIFFLTFFRVFLGNILKVYFLNFSISVKFLKVIYYCFIFLSLILSIKLFFNWTFREIFYLQFFNSSFWIKVFSKWGTFFFYRLDFGIFFKIENNLYLIYNKIYSFLKNFFLKNFEILIFFVFVFYFFV